MKEYKVVNRKASLTKANELLEDLLNQNAREGWRVIHIAENTARVVLERDKNR